MSDLIAEIDTGGAGPGLPVKTGPSAGRPRLQGHSTMMVPTVLHRRPDGNYDDLDYEAHVLRYVKWDALTYGKAVEIDLSAFDPARRSTAIVDLDAKVAERHEFVLAGGRIDRPGMARMMLNVIPNPWQGVRIIDEALEVLRKRFQRRGHIAMPVRAGRRYEGGVGDGRSMRTPRALFRRRVTAGEIVLKLVGSPFEKMNWTVDEVLTERVTGTETI